MVTVGYGDVKASSPDEKIFSILAMILVCGAFPYIYGSLDSVLSKHTKAMRMRRKKLIGLN